MHIITYTNTHTRTHIRTRTHTNTRTLTGDPGAKGYLKQVPDLMSVQAETFDRPTILLASSLSGEEEVPPGVVGVITPGITYLGHESSMCVT